MKRIKAQVSTDHLTEIVRSEKGATVVLIAVVITALLALAALAIDVGHIFVVDNELRNAADAGALAGGFVLYNDDATLNPGAIQVATDAAMANRSENIAVEIHDGDVQMGHWSFNSQTFIPYGGDPSAYNYQFIGKTYDELDVDTDFVNAVRVVTRRQDTPAAAYLAHIIGFSGFVRNAESIAYIGPSAGPYGPNDFDLPIVICQESITDSNGVPSCNIGRFINSGSNVETSETGGWTDFNQGLNEELQVVDNVCSGGTNANAIRDLIDPPGPVACNGHNPEVIMSGPDYPLATQGGEVQSAFDDLRNCWRSATDTNGDGQPDQPWSVTLPLIRCEDRNVGTCSEVVGALEVEIVWMTDTGQSTCNYSDRNPPPLHMGDWSCSISQPQSQTEWNTCWNEFVSNFGLQNVDGSPAPCSFKGIYFKPSCQPSGPVGNTGGGTTLPGPTNVLGLRPKLVK